MTSDLVAYLQARIETLRRERPRTANGWTALLTTIAELQAQIDRLDKAVWFK